MSAVPETPFVPFGQFEELRLARSIVQTEGQALLDLSRKLDAGFCAAVELIAATTGAVIVIGIGKAGLIGQKVVATLCSTGTRAYFLHPTEALHGDLGCISPQDTVLAFSNSGETDEVCRLLPLFRSQGLPIIAVTASSQSQLGLAATAVIELGRLQECGVHGLAPSTSTTAMLAIGDALAFVACRRKDFSPRDFAALHPGGSLGRRLTAVQDLMRSGDQVRIASEQITVREVFVAQSRPGRRTGAVMLVDDEGSLTGIFTDSDLARLLEQRRDDQLDRPIRDVMTAAPLTVTPDLLLEEVMHVLSSKRISELPVVDAEGRPVGLVDIVDIIGLLPAEGAGNR